MLIIFNFISVLIIISKIKALEEDTQTTHDLCMTTTNFPKNYNDCVQPTNYSGICCYVIILLNLGKLYA